MANADLQNIRDCISGVQEQMSQLRGHLDALSSCLLAGEFVTPEMAATVEESLRNCLKKEDDLRVAAAMLSIPVDSGIDELHAAVSQAENDEKAAALRFIVFDYFRLTSTAEKTLNALNESKKKLMEVCAAIKDEITDPLRPYMLVVERVKNEEDIDQDEYDFITKAIDRKIAGAIDQGVLAIDKDMDISQYLDGSCPILASVSIDSRHIKDNTETSITESVKIPDSPYQEASLLGDNSDETDNPDLLGTSTNPDETEEPEEAATDEKWAGFSGYVDRRISVRLENNTSVAKDGAKKFINRAKDHKESMIFGIHCIASTRMLQKGKTEEFYTACRYPSLSDQDYLRSHGYCADYVISEDGKESIYTVLSSKTYACLKKPNVVEYFKSFSRGKIEFPDAILDAPPKWSKLFAYRCKVLTDYLSCANIGALYTIMPAVQSRDYVYTCIRDSQSREYIVVPAVFEKAHEQPDINIITEYLYTNDTVLPLLLLVASRSDITILHPILCESHPEVHDLLRYVVISEPNIMLDGNLMPSELNVPYSEQMDLQGQDIVLETNDASSRDTSPGIPEQPTETTEGSTDIPLTTTILKDDSEEEITESAETEQATSPDEIARQYADIAREAFAKGRFDVGSVILKGLCKEISDYQTMNMQYAYATDDPMLPNDYRVANLLEVFSEQSGISMEYDLLAAAAWLRMYFSDSAVIEHYLLTDIVRMQGSLAYKVAPSLSDIMFALSEWVRKQARGLDSSLLGFVLKQNGIADQLSHIQKEARELIENDVLTQSNHYAKRIKRTRDILFARNGLITPALTAVAQNDETQIKSLSSTLSEFINPDSRENAIEKLINDSWRETSELAKKSKTEQLIGAEYSTLSRQLYHVFDLLGKWITGAKDTENVSGKQNRKAIELITSLKQLLSKAENETDAYLENNKEYCGAAVALRYTIREMSDRINGTYNEYSVNRNYYIMLLKEPFVALDLNFLPYIEEREEQIVQFGFCERVKKYLDMPDRSWEEVIERIFRTDEARQFGDFGCAGVLKVYLAEEAPGIKWPKDYDIEKYIARATLTDVTRVDSVHFWRQNLDAQLEMADGDGWFTTTASRNHYERVLNKQNESYYKENNFGFYGRTMLSILQHAHDEADKLRPRYRERLNKLKDTLGNDAQTLPIFERIADLIEKDRFGAADSYLQKAEKNDLSLSTDDLNDANSRFRKFIDCYPELCKSCALGKKMIEIFRERRRVTHNRDDNSAIELLVSWPEGNSSPSQITTVLGSLGLNTPVKCDGNGSEYHAAFHAPDRIETYPHPIYNFGSLLYDKGLSIGLLCGNHSAETLFNQVVAMQQKFQTDPRLKKSSDSPLLIIVNCAISLPERRKLARKFAKTLQTSAPFLIIDRVLAMYLADVPLSERWNVLIQCALPFQLAPLQNPYKENSSIEIPPDMFIGRVNELSAIINPSGPNLIYGGRQLGKTALLQRARTLQHRPEEKRWSAYVDIKLCGSDKAAVEITKKLMQCHFFDDKTTVSSWNELIESIEKHMIPDACGENHLLLLIDEADSLLTDCEKNGYQELDLLKRLQNSTAGRFKFVMAGLHNVMRFSKRALSSNSSLPQLQSYTVKPLSFTDARELLEKPLSYLGFSISDDEDIIAQILFNTNYFPGLVHFYASRLVTYMQNYASLTQMPPYMLNREVLTRLLIDVDFRNERVHRLKMTLGIDADEHSYYDILAHLLCYCCNNSENDMLYGMTADDIRRECKELSPNTSIATMEVSSITALLDELEELNILRTEKAGGTVRYLFSRPSFVEMLGEKGEVESHLLELLENEGIHNVQR